MLQKLADELNLRPGQKKDLAHPMVKHHWRLARGYNGYVTLWRLREEPAGLVVDKAIAKQKKRIVMLNDEDAMLAVIVANLFRGIFDLPLIEEKDIKKFNWQ